MSADVLHRVGPNALIQTLSAVRALAGSAMQDAVLNASGLKLPPGGWQDMVPADQVNRLNGAVLTVLGRDAATKALRDAGHRTGQYILDNRIPRLAQGALGLLPSRLARSLLLKAIGKSAWTFAGSAEVSVGPDWILIWNNPVCLGQSGYDGCAWHTGVFQVLFQTILKTDVDVRETHCIGRGDPYCRFKITLR
ncbi:MAG: bacteriochlorophyll 4-vinyl reductase [Pseudomonadota bacterium]